MIEDNPLACAAQAFVDARLASFGRRGKTDPERVLLARIAKFPFSKYPDYTAPWHLLQWPHMRWQHVHDVVAIIETLKHVKGALKGQYIILEPFQILILLCLLGPEHPDTHLRVVKEGMLTMARKSAKTTLMAGIATALMILHEDDHGLAGDELYVAASDRKQAGITFNIVNRFIKQDQDLGISELFHIVPYAKHMTHLTTLTEFEVLSSDAYRAHGLNPAVVIFDETGNIPAPAAEEFYSVLTSGFGAQSEPLTLLMSTQAPTDSHMFSQIVDRCKRINRREEHDISVAGFVFETPEQIGKEKLDPHDESKWYLANPGLGTIVSLDDMRKASSDAKALPAREARFRNLRLNQRANPHNPLITKSAWNECSGFIDYDELYGRRCYLALDLSGVKDLTCLSAVFDPDEGSTVRPVVPFFFMPGAGLLEKQQEDKVPYAVWAEQGFINIESDKTIDHDLVAGQIEFCINNYDVQGLGVDRWRIEDTKAALRARGLGDLADDPKFLFPIGQGYKDMNACVEALESAVLKHEINHGDHPVLTWCVSNTVATSDPAGNRKFDKVKSYGRIDGTVATAMALRVRELLGHDVEGASAFETEECAM